VGALGLLDGGEDSAELVLSRRVQVSALRACRAGTAERARTQTLDRFLLEQLVKEESLAGLAAVRHACACVRRAAWLNASVPRLQDRRTTVDRLFGMRVRTLAECQGGKHPVARETTTFAVDLQYPTTRAAVPFTQLLSRSLQESTTRRVWCEACKRYQPITRSKTILALPNVLDVHCNVATDAQLDLWRTPRKAAWSMPARGAAAAGGSASSSAWLPLYMRARLDTATGQVVFTDVTADNLRRVSGDVSAADGGKMPTARALQFGARADVKEARRPRWVSIRLMVRSCAASPRRGRW
jgi:hypothetical protein